MRKIDMIVVHCSATKEGKDFRAKEIKQWHLAQGWNDIGYHYVVGLDGKVEPGRPIEKAGAHATGFNANSIGICYVGGLDAAGKPKDTRTYAQKGALASLIAQLVHTYPEINRIVGHRDLGANKACPSFDAAQAYKNSLK